MIQKDVVTNADSERIIRDHEREEEMFESKLGKRYLTDIEPKI